MKLHVAKVIALVVCLGIVASNFVAMSHWSEDRGVYDDICYLRQAHLFQRFGVGGLDTSLAREDDGYLHGKLKLLPGGWDDRQMPPCHTAMPALDKWVLQYPPGTGFVLSLFPAGSQVVPLYATSTLLIFAFAAAAILRARTQATLGLAAVSGAIALYMMINPTKASYSMAPTMVVCAAAGWLTARLFNARSEPALAFIAILGLLLGLSVNLRVANLFLASGYAVFLFGTFLFRRDVRSFATGLLFGLGLLIGMLPTLAANAINAGSPFATTYGSADTAAPQLDWSTLREYARDPQFALLLLALAWTALLWRDGSQRKVTLLVLINLAINIAFFATHPVFTPYYAIPSAAISLWTLLFATLERGGISKPAPAAA
jgi:hypothetical protein